MVNVLISLFTRLGFHQCCIRCCFLALRWHLVNLWRGLFDLPAVPVSQTWWARKFLPLLCCGADSFIITWLPSMQVFFSNARKPCKIIFTLTSGNGQPETFRSVLGSAACGSVCPRHSYFPLISASSLYVQSLYWCNKVPLETPSTCTPSFISSLLLGLF